MAIPWTVSPSLPVPEIVARDEAALSLGEFRVQVARCAGTALSLGISQRMDAEEAQKAREMDIPTLRRPSGGTGLIHREGDIFWSVVLPRASPRVGRDFLRRYSLFGAGWVEFLARRKVASGWEKAPSRLPSFCLLSGRGEVLAIDGRVVGGASQHLTSRALLHHGTVVSTMDPALLERVFGLAPAFSRLHLTSLSAAGVTVTDEDLEDLAECLAKPLA